MIFWQLFITFFQIGLFTIGGGYAMIPMIEEEVVRQGWLTHTQLVDFIAVAESTPALLRSTLPPMWESPPVCALAAIFFGACSALFSRH